MDALGELRCWYERLRLEPGLTVTWRGPEPVRAKASVCLCAEGPSRIGALTMWETREAQLTLGNVTSGEVTDECLHLIDAEALAEAVVRLRNCALASNV